MKSKELVVYEACNGQCVESLHKQVISIDSVLVEAFCAEVKESRHLSALVVAAQHVNREREVKFQRVKQKNNLDGEGAPVHVVAQKEVPEAGQSKRVLLCAFGGPANTKHFDHVVVLAMDVANDGHGVLETEKVRFFF